MFFWKDYYSVNIINIDNQHKELFRIANKLSNFIKEYDIITDQYDDIKQILNELTDYTIYHFQFEEDLMLTNGYEDISIHKVQHETFINKIKMLEFNEDIYINQKRSMLEALSFLLDWVSNHILITDMKYKAFLNGKGVI